MRPGEASSRSNATLRPPLTADRVNVALFFVGVLLLLPIGMWQTEVSPASVTDAFVNLMNLGERMWPPNTNELPRYLEAVLVTVWMVIAGTGLALVLAVPTAVLGARNMTSGRVGFGVSRALIVGSRAIPQIIWAMLFVRMVGIGPTAGVLALAVNSIGMMGKFYADAIEEIDPGPLEALRASGASKLQQFTSGVLPQVAPTWISLFIYRMDVNIRVSVILGYVGAGGIGLELQRVQGQLAYRRMFTIVVLILLLIVILEYLSAVVRRLVIGEQGERRRGPNPFGMRAALRRHRESYGLGGRAKVKVPEPVGADMPAGRPPAATADPVGPLGDPDAPLVPEAAEAATEETAQPPPVGADPEQAERERSAEELHRREARRARQRLRAPLTGHKRAKLIFFTTYVVLFAISLPISGVTPGNIGGHGEQFVNLLTSMFPPDFTTRWDRVSGELIETFWIALTATILGMLLSLPFAVLAARTYSPSMGWYRFARISMVLERGIPELILAIIFVIAVGLGPFAGVLALTVGAIGFTGKLLADSMENLDRGPADAIASVGGSWLQQVVSGLLPRAVPSMVSVGLYTFDVYVRAATILGIVGAGGIGVSLSATSRQRDFDQMLAIIIIIFVVVYAVERFSGWLRKRLV